MTSNLLIVAALFTALFAAPFALRAIRIWRVSQKGWIDFRAFLIANNLDEKTFQEMCVARGIRLRVKIIADRPFVPGVIAADILEAIRSLSARNAETLERDIASGAITGTIAAFAGVLLTIRQTAQDTGSQGRREAPVLSQFEIRMTA